MAFSKKGLISSSSALSRVMEAADASKLLLDWDRNERHVKLIYKSGYRKRNTARGNAGSRWDLYSQAATFEEYVTITDGSDLFRDGYSGKGYDDLKYDLQFGLVTFEVIE